LSDLGLWVIEEFKGLLLAIAIAGGLDLWITSPSPYLPRSND
jgi:hypothetical protein